MNEKLKAKTHIVTKAIEQFNFLDLFGSIKISLRAVSSETDIASSLSPRITLGSRPLKLILLFEF
jgi:hypothetical protein